MDLKRMIAELRYELTQLDSAIESLERLVASRGKRRGRPTGWMKAAISDAKSSATPSGRKRRPARAGRSAPTAPPLSS